MRPRVAVLFLGETLLIPHLWPIVPALARLAPDLAVDLWAASGVHERLLAGWIAEKALDPSRVRIRRAPGYRAAAGHAEGQNPPLPPKLPTLLRLWPRLWRTPVALCAEQTSLWIPRALPTRTRFLKTSHGVGSMSARDDKRRRAAWRLLVPSAREKATYAARGFADDAVVVTGYVKAAFMRRQAARARLFADDRPVLLYTPHWQRFRSSWWEWGRDVVAMLAAQERFNVILQPHQRLVEKDPSVRDVLAAVAGRPHVRVDLDSFACVDGTYTGAADLYLGDTSSQVVEYLARPRPCVFLNPGALDWRATDDHDFWTCGEVVENLAALPTALERAAAEHPRYVAAQESYAAAQLGDTSDEAPVRAARAVLAALKR